MDVGTLGTGSPRPAATAATATAAGEAAASTAAGRRALGRVVRRDRASDGAVEVTDHRVHEAGGVAAGVGAGEVARDGRLLADLDAVLRRPLVGAVEGDRPR